MSIQESENNRSSWSQWELEREQRERQYNTWNPDWIPINIRDIGCSNDTSIDTATISREPQATNIESSHVIYIYDVQPYLPRTGTGTITTSINAPIFIDDERIESSVTSESITLPPSLPNNGEISRYYVRFCCCKCICYDCYYRNLAQFHRKKCCNIYTLFVFLLFGIVCGFLILIVTVGVSLS